MSHRKGGRPLLGSESPGVSGTVSVIVPCRDGAAYLSEALASIQRQAGPRCEVVVVDDGSVDQSNAIARDSGAKVVRNDGRGPAAARNTGVRVASSEWLAFLDADDVWTDDSLAVRSAAVGDLDVCFGAMAMMDDPGHSLGPVRLPGTMLISRELWTRVGPLAEDRLGGYMLDWVDRLTDAAVATANVEDVVLLRRAHENNLSRHPHMTQDYLYWARAIATRRRAR